MAHLEDRWFTADRKPKPRSGHGKRYRVRYEKPDGTPGYPEGKRMLTLVPVTFWSLLSVPLWDGCTVAPGWHRAQAIFA